MGGERALARGARILIVFISYCVVVLAATCAHAQSGGQTGGSGSTGTTTIPPSTAPRPERPLPQERRTVWVSGRVVVDDGTPPPGRVTIERVCSGRVRREASSDSHGQFGFQLGSAVQELQDASVGSMDMAANAGRGDASMPSPGLMSGMGSEGITEGELMSCELRANLPGFYSDSISLAGRRISGSFNAGTIVLHRIGKVEGSRVSVSSLQAPRNAKKAFERGQELLKKQSRAEAAEEIRKAIELYPKYAEAQLTLSELYAEQGRKQEAGRLLEQAIESDPKFLPPYIVLARLAGDQNNWPRMAEFSERALTLNAYEYPVAYFYHAIANYNLEKYEVAEKSARTARRLDSQYRLPRIDFLLANVLLQRQDYAGASAQLRTFLEHGPAAAEAQMARDLLAQSESKLAQTRK